MASWLRALLDERGQIRLLDCVIVHLVQRLGGGYLSRRLAQRVMLLGVPDRGRQEHQSHPTRVPRPAFWSRASDVSSAACRSSITASTAGAVCCLAERGSDGWVGPGNRRALLPSCSAATSPSSRCWSDLDQGAVVRVQQLAR